MLCVGFELLVHTWLIPNETEKEDRGKRCTIMMSSRYRCVVCWFWVAGTYLAHSKWNRERGQRKESRAQLQNKLTMFHRYFQGTFWKLILGTSQQYVIWHESARIHNPSRYALGMSQECILDTCALWVCVSMCLCGYLSVCLSVCGSVWLYTNFLL